MISGDGFQHSGLIFGKVISFLYLIGMEEIWKDIYYYDHKKEKWIDLRGCYQVSNFGRVKSLSRAVKKKNRFGKTYTSLRPEKIIKQGKHRCGYFQVGLQVNNIRETFYVHRLVAEMFIPNPNNLPCINHKDEDKHNNILTNLEWCDYQYNITYGTALKRMVEKNIVSVLQIAIEGEILNTFSSLLEAGIKTGVNSAHICHCCKGKRKTAGGFIWRYAT